MAVFGEREARILVLGLDNAGKTTILCKLQRLSVGYALAECFIHLGSKYP